MLALFTFRACGVYLMQRPSTFVFVLESLSLVKVALIAKRVFFKTLPRSVNTSFMATGHGQGVLKRKHY